MDQETVRAGRRGTIVSELHQALLEAGATIPGEELASAYFGPRTLAALEHFQATHVDQTGHALVIDGVVGIRTWWALEHPAGWRSSFIAPGWRCSPTDARPALVEVVGAAVSAIGTVEVPPGSNRGPKIDQWTSRAGLRPGDPWCAAFATAACYPACDGGSPIPPLGSAWKIREWGEEHGRILPAGEAPLPGDLGVFIRPGGHGHVVLVGSPLGAGRFSCVEGNSSNAVRGTVRTADAFTALVRPLPLP